MAFTIPAMTSARANAAAPRLGRVAGACLALVAGVYQAAVLSIPINDDFLHFALARQVLAGDWPVRDFFDSGLALMYGLSALAQRTIGYRLLAEAVIVGVATAVATYLVFRLVQRLTASTVAGALAATVVLVATPRGYSYPKVIVYAVAATLWWAYVRKPSAGRAVALGAWIAAAFYWRPDHGVYVAGGVLLAMVAAHGVRVLTLLRTCQAAATAAVLVAPFFLLVAATMGVRPYIESGIALAEAQHVQMDTHAVPAWPIRSLDELVRVDSAETYAPIVTIRWTQGSSASARVAVLARHGLSPVGDEENSAQRVRLSDRSLLTLRGLVNEPVVEDTAGIDRGTATLTWATFPPWQRWSFDHPWMRVRLFPGVDEQGRAAEAVAALFYVVPVLVLMTALWLPQYLAPEATALRLFVFALFAVITNIGLLRTPYAVRAVEGAILPAILFGCCVAAVWRAARVSGAARRVVLAAGSAAIAVLVIKSTAVAGQFGDRAAWLAGDWRSLERARGAWAGVRDRLVADPPLSYWKDRPSPASIRLAAYAHACVPPSDRLLVLWFAPEIYYYADRLAAPRHLVFVPGYQALAHEQQLTVAKIERFSPPIVFANSSLDTNTRAIYPAVVDYVHREYDVAATMQEDGERYLILVRRDRRAAGRYGAEMWPCYG